MLALVALAAGAFLALVAIALLGGRGDRGDGVRVVDLPAPASHLGQVTVLATSVLVAGSLLAAAHHVLMRLTDWWVALLLRMGGLSPQRIAAYAPEVYPLLGAFLVVALVLFHLVRGGGAASMATGFAITAHTALTLMLVDAAVDALAAVAGIPVIATVYVVNIVSLCVGLLGFLAGIFRSGALPRRYAYQAVVPGLRSGVAITSVAMVALLAGAVGFRLVTEVLQPAYTGSALVVFLVIPVALTVFQVMLFAVRRKERPGVPDSWDAPLDVIVPAWNEEAQIAAVLHRIDLAARAYPGPVRVIVADDGSTDGTVAAVTGAAGRASAAQIVLLRGEHTGKAQALNRALEFATAAITIRIDADVLVHPQVFRPLPGWFANPSVGCVGAFNLPEFSLPAWYTKGRLFECLYTFGFSRLAYERFDANNIPGTFMAFRHAEALALGGFAEGMNGEDSDLAFNLGRLGLVSVIDPAIVVYEDVPQTAREFIEQRTRWARASIHLAARHLPRAGSEYTSRFVILLHFVFSKVSALLRPVTYLTGAVLIIGDGRPATMVLRGLLLLALGFIPQVGLLAILAVTYRCWRELPWLFLWIPYTMVRKIGMLNGILSIPPYRRARVPGPGSAEPASAEVAAA